MRTVLNGVNLSINGGEFVALLGHSGSGKSTLLNLISGIEKPTSGSIVIEDVDITAFRERERTLFRRDHMGFVFQFFNLIPTLTVLENVMLPLIPRSGSPRYWRESSQTILARLNAGELVGQSVSTLSGGQRQRVATARALVDAPDYILADEPTAHQDLKNAQRLGQLLRQAAERGAVVVVAAHDRHVDEWLKVDQHLSLADGNLEPAP